MSDSSFTPLSSVQYCSKALRPEYRIKHRADNALITHQLCKLNVIWLFKTCSQRKSLQWSRHHVCPQSWCQTVGPIKCFVLSMLVVNWMCPSNKEVLLFVKQECQIQFVLGFCPVRENVGFGKHICPNFSPLCLQYEI